MSDKKCDHCGSMNTTKNGTQVRWKGGRRYKVQMHLCHDCGRTTLGEREWLPQEQT